MYSNNKIKRANRWKLSLTVLSKLVSYSSFFFTNRVILELVLAKDQPALSYIQCMCHVENTEGSTAHFLERKRIYPSFSSKQAIMNKTVQLFSIQTSMPSQKPYLSRRSKIFPTVSREKRKWSHKTIRSVDDTIRARATQFRLPC